MPFAAPFFVCIAIDGVMWYNPSMAWFPNKKQTDVKRILLEHQEEIHEIVRAMMDGQKDVASRINRLLANEPKHIRDAILKRMREHVQLQHADSAHELERIFQEQQWLDQERLQIKKQRMWLAYVLPQDTMRKIVDSLRRSPALNKQLADIGNDLAKKGVTVSLQHGRNELGQLQAMTQHQQDRRNDQERGI